MNLLMGNKNELVLKKEEYKYTAQEKFPIRDILDIFSEQIKDGSRILDIGCGQGKYAFLKERGCKLFGVDIDPTAIDLAVKNGYDAAKIIDVENEEEFQKCDFSHEHYDAVILHDVLEHLYDPARVIVNASKYLKEDGKILISIPNIAHVDILLHLLDGEFNYGQLGIMDNTHVRFFTKKSFAKMIENINQSGLASFDCRCIGEMFFDGSYSSVYEKKYPALWRALNGSVQRNALQILFMLTKVSDGDEKPGLSEIVNTVDHTVDRIGSCTDGDGIQFRTNYRNVLDSEREWYEHLLKAERDAKAEILNWNEKLTQTVDRMESGWKEALKANEELAQAVGEMEAGRKEILNENQNLAQTVQEMEAGRKGILDENRNLTQTVQEMEIARREAVREIENLTRTIREMEASRKELLKMNENLEQTVQEMENGWKKALASNEELRQTASEMEAGWKESIKSSNELQQNNNELQQSNNELQQNNNELQQNNEELTAEIQTLSYSTAELTAQLDSVKSELNDVRASFGWRVLHFLKIAK